MSSHTRSTYSLGENAEQALKKCHYIEAYKTRQAVFGKRKRSVFKKAMELSIMCGARVSLHISSEKGKHFMYEGTPGNVTEPPSIVIPDEYYTNVDYERYFAAQDEDEIGQRITGRRKRAKFSSEPIPSFFIPGTQPQPVPKMRQALMTPQTPNPCPNPPPNQMYYLQVAAQMHEQMTPRLPTGYSPALPQYGYESHIPPQVTPQVPTLQNAMPPPSTVPTPVPTGVKKDDREEEE